MEAFMYQDQDPQFMQHCDSMAGPAPSTGLPRGARSVSFIFPTIPSDHARICVWPNDLPPGNDTLTHPTSDQRLGSVNGLHAWIIEARSPLIAAAFESSNSGQRLHLEALCSNTVLPFVRFLYTGSYAHYGDWKDVPTSVWLHCKMYYLGHLYDLVDLKSQAYVNVLRQCEFGCSSPNMPIDLCHAIEFVYKSLSRHDAISDALVQCCVTRCLSHRLHEDANFRNVAFSVRAFHQDLTKACRVRGYEDESAAVIIQLPYMHHASDTFASMEHPPIARFEDVVHHFHGSDGIDVDSSLKKRQRATLDERQMSPTKIPKMNVFSGHLVENLALRPAPEEVPANANEDNDLGVKERLQGMCELSKEPLKKRPAYRMPASTGSYQQDTSNTQANLPMRPLLKLPIWKRRTVEFRKPCDGSSTADDESLPAHVASDGYYPQPTRASRTEEEQRIEEDLYENSSSTTERQIEPIAESFQPSNVSPTLPPTVFGAFGAQMALQDFIDSPKHESYHRSAYNDVPAQHQASSEASRSSFPSNVCDVLARRQQRAERVEASLHRFDHDQFQLMMDEQREKKRLLMARQAQEDDSQYKHLDRFQLMMEEQKEKKRLLMARQEESVDAPVYSTVNRPSAPAAAAGCQVDTMSVRHPLQDPQMRLMLQEQKRKKDLLMARLNASPVPSPPSAPAAVPNIPAGSNHALQDYQMQLMLLEQQKKKNELIWKPNQDSVASLNASPVPSPPPAPAAVPNIPACSDHGHQDYQMQVMLMEQQKQQKRKDRLARRANQDSMASLNASPVLSPPPAPAAVPDIPAASNHAHQDYQMQLMLLEQQNKKRLAMARQEQEASNSSNLDVAPSDTLTQSAPMADTSGTQQDASAATCAVASSAPVPQVASAAVLNILAGPNHALQDYQMQLMLLDQQNRKRLVMARQEQDAFTKLKPDVASRDIRLPVTGMSGTQQDASASTCAVASSASVPQVVSGAVESLGEPEKSLTDASGQSPGSQLSELGYHQMQPMHLEQREKTESPLATSYEPTDVIFGEETDESSENESVQDTHVPQPEDEYVPEPYQLRLMALERQSKERLALARPSTKAQEQEQEMKRLLGIPARPEAGMMEPLNRACDGPHLMDHTSCGLNGIEAVKSVVDTPGYDVLANFDFDKFLRPDTPSAGLGYDRFEFDAPADGSFYDEPQAGVASNSIVTEASRIEPPALNVATFSRLDGMEQINTPEVGRVESAKSSTPVTTAGDRGSDNDIDMCGSDSDSDGQSWVDVPLQRGQSAAVPGATAPGPTTAKRSMSSSSDSEWDLC